MSGTPKSPGSDKPPALRIEPSDITNSHDFMDALVEFLNEASTCLHEVKQRSGLGAGCTSPVHMNDNEKDEKLDTILATLTEKFAKEASALKPVAPPKPPRKLPEPEPKPQGRVKCRRGPPDTSQLSPQFPPQAEPSAQHASGSYNRPQQGSSRGPPYIGGTPYYSPMDSGGMPSIYVSPASYGSVPSYDCEPGCPSFVNSGRKIPRGQNLFDY